MKKRNFYCSHLKSNSLSHPDKKGETETEEIRKDGKIARNRQKRKNIEEDDGKRLEREEKKRKKG